jgi:hypothetical protein
MRAMVETQAGSHAALRLQLQTCANEQHINSPITQALFNQHYTHCSNGTPHPVSPSQSVLQCPPVRLLPC